MNIQKVENPQVVELGTLKKGNFFLFNDQLYIKYTDVLYLNLEKYEVSTFGFEETLVIPCEANFVQKKPLTVADLKPPTKFIFLDYDGNGNKSGPYMMTHSILEQGKEPPVYRHVDLQTGRSYLSGGYTTHEVEIVNE